VDPAKAAVTDVPAGSLRALILVDVFARISYGLARTPMLPLFAAFLGASPAMIGFIGAAGTVTGIVFKLPAGAISDQVGRRGLMTFGLFVFATGPLLYVAVASQGALAGVRFYHGLATAIYGPVAMAAVAALAGSRRGEYLSWLSNSKIIGKLLGAFLGGAILSYAILEPTTLADALSWETLRAAMNVELVRPQDLSRDDFGRAYLVCAFFGVAALAIGLLVLRRVPDVTAAKGRTLGGLWRDFVKGIREVVNHRPILLASGAEGVQNLTVGILEHFLPIYAVFVAGLSPLEAGAIYGGQILTTILAKPAFGRFSDRHGRRGVILAGLWLCAVPFALTPWFDAFLPLLLLSMVFGMGEALVTSSSGAMVGDLCRKEGLGAAMGVFGTIHDTGHALGPILGGLLIGALAGPGAVGHAPLPYRVTFGAVGAVLALYALLFAARSRRADPSATPPTA
jgi:DHA1 family multidrug resistance protein-like MFS transporter